MVDLRPSELTALARPQKTRVERFIEATGCSRNFFLAWTTAADKFILRYRRTVESTLKYHPTACLVVYSPTLPLDYFKTFWDLGYNIIVERPDVEYLIKGTPAQVATDPRTACTTQSCSRHRTRARMQSHARILPRGVVYQH